MSVTYTHVSSKLGKVKPETKSISKELFDAAKKEGHEIWFMWGMGSSSEHATGLALDLMVRNEKGGDWIRNYIWKNRERLRLRHVIWEQHITSTVTQPGVRRKMEDRGSVTENHYDHIHVLFFQGTYRAPEKKPSTKPSTGPSTKPVPKPGMTVNQVAREVLQGKWGNGEQRKDRLEKAGYDYEEVQSRVEYLMGKTSKPDLKKTTAEVAREVIQGKWGDGSVRVRRLAEAGYKVNVVQDEVNRLMRQG